jgi:hypothetical protein
VWWASRQMQEYAGSRQPRYEQSSDVLIFQSFSHCFVCYTGFGRLHLTVCNQALIC